MGTPVTPNPTPLPTKEPTDQPTNSPSTASPTTSEPTPPTCTVCDDRESNWMINNTNRMNTKCNKNAKWTEKGWCRLSCYLSGNGYPGDVCCGPATPDPTSAPTKKPTNSPTANPVTPAPTP